MAFDFKLWMSSQTFTNTEEGLLSQNVLSLPSTSTTQEIGNITSTELEVKLATQDNDDQINDEEDDNKKNKRFDRKKRERVSVKKKKYKQSDIKKKRPRKRKDRQHSKSSLSSSCLEEELVEEITDESDEDKPEQVVDEVVDKEEGSDSDVDADEVEAYNIRHSDNESLKADEDITSKNKDSEDEDLDSNKAIKSKSSDSDDEDVNADEAVTYKGRDSDDEAIDADVTSKGRDADETIASGNEDVEIDGKDIKSTPKNVKKRLNRKSRSILAAFSSLRSLHWSWSGEGSRYGAKKGPMYYTSLHGGDVSITIGDVVVLFSSDNTEGPYVGKIVMMWETRGIKKIETRWYYHAKDIRGCKKLAYPGGVLESDKHQKNEVETISHKCDILTLKKFKKRLNNDPELFNAVYENKDVFYFAGFYNFAKKTSHIREGIPFALE